jgi:tellurite resistance-related uncharacterized protein
MDHGQLPPDVHLVRTTDEFTDTSVPTGLLRAHRVASGVWGRLRVLDGALRFVWETGDDGDGESVDLAAGDSLVIPPDTPHRVEPGPGSRFVVEFHR